MKQKPFWELKKCYYWVESSNEHPSKLLFDTFQNIFIGE